MNKNEFRELLDFAIEQEQDAADFYVGLAAKVTSPHVRRMLLEFADQERGHKAKLQGMLGRKSLQPQVGAVADLKISDYLVDVEPAADLNYQGALILAMKKEKAAFRLYTDLAKVCDDPELRGAFLYLAQEEANHKLLFETEYDDKVLTEN